MRHPHLQTILAHFWPRRLDTRRFPVERRLLPTEPGAAVLLESQSPAQPRGHVVLVHGLEGSGQAGYMLSFSQAALEAGFAAHRFHLRSCGLVDQTHWQPYHAGMTCDLRAVLESLPTPSHLVGFSLGGNVVLKLAGELGSDGHRLLISVCAVSTPLDLAACVRRLGQRQNRVYEVRFLRKMRRRLRSTRRWSAADLRALTTLYALDDRVTAPYFGFGCADRYYATQSCSNFLEAIQVPALLIQAQDDPLVPFEVFRHPAFARNPHLRLLATPYGGHLGFLARGNPRLWLDAAVLQWIFESEGTIGGSPSSYQ